MARIVFQLHPKQFAFRHSPAQYRGFVAGVGSGKSVVGAYDLIRRAKPGRLYMAVAPTYPMLSDSTWRSLLEVGSRLGFIREVFKSPLRMILGNGAEILGKSAEWPDRLRGPNLSGVWIDEASVAKKKTSDGLNIFEVLIGRLRQGGEQGWLSATFTPKGRDNWTYEVFGPEGCEKFGVELFSAKTTDNPFLHEGFYKQLARYYTDARARQELHGEFVDLTDGEWPPEYFGDELRFANWPDERDLCAIALDPSKGKERDYGDYSAFVIVKVSHGRLWVDAVIERMTAGDIIDVAKALYDEHQPDAFGIEANQFQELLAAEVRRAWPHIPVHEIINSQNKIGRVIGRLTPELKEGCLRFKKHSAGAEILLSQLKEFPKGQYDDGPDALEMAVRLAGDLAGSIGVGAMQGVMTDE